VQYIDKKVTKYNDEMCKLFIKDSNQKFYAKGGPFSVWDHTTTIVKYDFQAIRGLSL
jgi:hypothetical protein